MTARRSPRNLRRPRRSILTVRDAALLRGLNRFRLARSSDLRRVFFNGVSAGRAAERLRQLFAAGFLEVRVGRLSEENVYALGPTGRRWLEVDGGIVGRLPAGGVMHHLAIVSVWTQLAAAVRSRPGVRLKLFRPDWEIRALGQPLPVVPDALIELESGQQVVRVAVEVDLASERHGALRHKFERYRQLLWQISDGWGWSNVRLVAVAGAGGERRQAALRRLAEKAGIRDAVVVDAKVWPDALWPLLSVTPLTTPANGARGPGTVSTDVANVPPASEAGPSPKDVAGNVGS